MKSLAIFLFVVFFATFSSCRTTEKDSETKGIGSGGLKNVKKEMCAATGTPLPGSTYSVTVFPGLDEEWPACTDKEIIEFNNFTAKIRQLQEVKKDKNRKFKFRGFHAKSHGCMTGYLEVNNPATRQTESRYLKLRKFNKGKGEPSAYGIFAKQAKLPVYLRFSSAQGKFQNDRSPDGKGIAIKVMNVPNSTMGSQDFTMSSTPICNAVTAAEFMVLGHTIAQGTLSEKAKLFTKPVERKAVISTLASAASWKPSVATESYWTRTAYRMGPYGAKYLVTPTPCKGETASAHKKSKLSFQRLQEYVRYQKDLSKLEDYYRDELTARSEKGDICFSFQVQFQTDPKKTPIENPTIEWTNQLAPPITLGTIVLPKAQGFNSPASNQYCEKIGFTPEAFIKEHMPIGHMNRARLAVYKASREYRQKQYKVPAEPKNVSDIVK